MIRKHPFGLWICAAVCAFMALPSHAQTYSRFGPASGVLVGDITTPQTTAAEASDIISLWTGTCNSTTFLRADGSCQAAGGGSGTVTSVGLTVPTGLSVTGSPITTTGTLAISTTLNGLLRGTGSGFATAASSNVISLWSGTCDTTTYLRGDGSCVTPGGGGGGGTVTSVGLTMPSGFSVASSPVTTTGTLAVTTTLSGVLAGNGSGFTTATNSNVISLWTGTCSASTFLRGDGSCQSVSVPAGANPSASIGLTANNGVATTFMRSDGTPALSQAITPTWTAQHNFATTTRIGPSPSATLLTGAGRLQMVGTTSVIPSVVWSNNNATTNMKSWDLAAFDSGTFVGRSFNDAGDTAANWLIVDKVSNSHVIANTNILGNVVQINGVNAQSAALFSSGTLPVARGGTGTGTSTGTGNVVLSASPTFTGTVSAATVAASAVTVGGQNVCQQNGTNCPSAGATSATDSPTCNGFSSVSTCQASWTKVGRTACISVRGGGNSNTTSFTITGLTAPVPLSTGNANVASLTDNGAGVFGLATVNSAGNTLTLGTGPDGAATGFTPSGTKTVTGTFCYPVSP